VARRALPSQRGSSEIWLPDITPNNVAQGAQASFEGAYAQVYHTGTVVWSRPGQLEILCRYSGLINFPEDRLRCSFEMGGWFVSGAYQGVDLKRKGYVIAPKVAGFEGAKSSYAEQTRRSRRSS
jgi:hypothetical protein